MKAKFLVKFNVFSFVCHTIGEDSLLSPMYSHLLNSPIKIQESTPFKYNIHFTFYFVAIWRIVTAYSQAFSILD